jgi:hypothetical protein
LASLIIAGLTLLLCFLLWSIINEKFKNRKLLKTVTNENRGTETERDLVLKLLKFGIPSNAVFHDLYIRKINGNYSQVDLVVVSKSCILVFEVKSYSGWIFGSVNNSYWTQVLAYGSKKFSLYNPIRQNNRHVLDLKNHLNLYQDLPFFSIIVFYGNCEFKSSNTLPDKTYLIKSGDIFKLLKSFKENNLLDFYECGNRITEKLTKAVINGDNENIRIEHIKNIEEMIKRKKFFN